MLNNLTRPHLLALPHWIWTTQPAKQQLTNSPYPRNCLAIIILIPASQTITTGWQLLCGKCFSGDFTSVMLLSVPALTERRLALGKTDAIPGIWLCCRTKAKMRVFCRCWEMHSPTNDCVLQIQLHWLLFVSLGQNSRQKEPKARRGHLSSYLEGTVLHTRLGMAAGVWGHESFTQGANIREARAGILLSSPFTFSTKPYSMGPHCQYLGWDSYIS